MRLLRNFLVILLSLIFFPLFLFALDNAGREAFEVFISLEKATFESNEPVLLYINIKNKSGIKNTFKVYDSEYITFRPVVYDMDGHEAETLVKYRLKNQTIAETIKDKSARIIELAQNEIFSHSIDLKNIYKINTGREYRVKAIFSADAENDSSILSYNQLHFTVLAPVSDIKNSGISRIRRFTSPVRELSPSEIVVLLLKAEKERNWENYFKYIDIEKYINSYPDYIRIYNQAVKRNDIELKEKIVLEFVNFLKEERTDFIISYKVRDELKKNENSSFVEALVKRYSAGNPFIYKYRYSLEKYDDLWLITNVEVTVAKGQKL